MEWEIVERDGQTSCRIKGLIDEKAAEELKEVFTGLNLALVKEVILDCRGMDYIGSSGIGKILLLYKHLAENGGRLSVINLKDDIYELFVELKLHTVFSVQRRDGREGSA